MLEHAAGAFPRRRIEMRDGVREPPGLADDRDGTVAHRIELCQAARLVARGHHEQIAARDDSMRERLVVSRAEREPLAVRRRKLAERRLEPRLAAPEDREAGARAPEQLGQRGGEQIDALLLDEARDRADERRIVDEPELGAELELDAPFSGCVAPL